jgi:hypothetical protein
MFLNEMPEDMIMYIFLFLPSNKDTLNTMKTCKELYRIGMKNGFLKTISLRPDNCDRFLKNIYTIDTATIEDQKDPQSWIFRFPRQVICKRCTLTGPFIPNNVTNTEVLDFKVHTSRRMFRTDWSLFPKLRVLTMKVYDIDVTGLDELPNLGTVHIRTQNGFYTRAKVGDPITYQDDNTDFILAQLATIRSRRVPEIVSH